MREGEGRGASDSKSVEEQMDRLFQYVSEFLKIVCCLDNLI